MNRNAMRNELRCVIAASLAMGLLWAFPISSRAQTTGLGSTTQARLPENLSDATGFAVALTMHDPLSHGYVKLDIVIKADAAWTTQRRFVVRLIPIKEHLPSRNAAIINIPVETEQGKRQISVSRRIPKWTIGETYNVRLMEDGQTIENYVSEIGNPLPNKKTRGGYPLPDETYHNVLAIDQAPPPKSIVGYGNYPILHPATIEELPTDWRDYRSVDTVFISATELERIRGLDDDTVFAAFREWVLMGGTVLVTGKSNAVTLSDSLDLKVTVAQDSTDWLNSNVSRQLRAAKKQLSDLQSFRKKASIIRRLVDQMLKEKGINPRYALPEYFSDGTENPDALRPDPDLTEGSPDDPPTQVSEPGLAETIQSEFDYPTLRERYEEELGIEPIDPPGQVSVMGMMSGQEDFFTEVMMPLNYSAPFGVEVDAVGAALPRSLEKSEQMVQWIRQTIDLQETLNDRLKVSQVAAGLIIWNSDGRYMTTMETIALSDSFGGRISHGYRRGVDPLLGDARAARWMIPGVAQPPVYTFMGLLGLFVVLVGPVAYRQTSKAKRSYLMFAIAPILALVTTIAMIGYSVTADGFGTITRVRQLTWVDGQSGDAAERVRSTYFAGVRPADGLRFSRAAEVMPYRLNVDDAWEDVESEVKEVRHEITIDNDHLRLGQSYMPSRSQQQFVAHQPRKSVGFIELVGMQPSGAAPPPRVSSTFDFPLRRLILCDASENYWGCDELPAGGKEVELIALGDVESRTQLGDLYNNFRPEAATNRSATNRNNQRRNPYSYRQREETRDLIQAIARINDHAGTALTDGLFESWLNSNLLISSSLPPNHFVATADVSEDVIAVPGAEVVSSVRYVFGSMR